MAGSNRQPGASLAAVATEAAQLAGRGMIPRVHAPVALADALAAIVADARVVACTFEGEHR